MAHSLLTPRLVAKKAGSFHLGLWPQRVPHCVLASSRGLEPLTRTGWRVSGLSHPASAWTSSACSSSPSGSHLQPFPERHPRPLSLQPAKIPGPRGFPAWWRRRQRERPGRAGREPAGVRPGRCTQAGPSKHGRAKEPGEIVHK